MSSPPTTLIAGAPLDEDGDPGGPEYAIGILVLLVTFLLVALLP